MKIIIGLHSQVHSIEQNIVSIDDEMISKTRCTNWSGQVLHDVYNFLSDKLQKIFNPLSLTLFGQEGVSDFFTGENSMKFS